MPYNCNIIQNFELCNIKQNIYWTTKIRRKIYWLIALTDRNCTICVLNIL